MPSDLIDAITTELEKRGEVKPEGKGWRTRCPNPGHDDRHPSFFLYPGGGGRCFSQCNNYWPPVELATLLGISPPQQKQGLTLAELAEAKGLPEEFLRSLGVLDGFAGNAKGRVPCVDIPYMSETGEVMGVHKRLSLHGDLRFIWRRGDHPILYGLARLSDIRKAGFVILIEGEGDAWTLWYNRIPSLALPGASTWRKEFSPLFDGLDVFLWREPDEGGNTLMKTASADLPGILIIQASPAAKDPSELYLQDPERFKERMEVLLRAARPASELRQEAVSAEACKLFEEGRPALV